MILLVKNLTKICSKDLSLCLTTDQNLNYLKNWNNL
jgi:hypothetical protein